MGFGVYLKTKVGERQRAGDMAEVFPTQRYNAHMVPEDGSLTCSTPGICESGPNPTPKTPSPGILTPPPPHPADVLRFDNTYSYIHAKRVSYTVEVLLPDAASAQQIQQLGGEKPAPGPLDPSP